MHAPIESASDLFGAARRIHTEWFGQGPTWFRGESRKKDWKLVPRVYRHVLKYSRAYEANLLVEFDRRSRTRATGLPDDSDHVGWLHLMQHYGLPTRLLDWTTSILVAAFFAVEEKRDWEEDGRLWALCPTLLNRRFLGSLTVARPAHPMVKGLAREAFDLSFECPGKQLEDRVQAVVAIYPSELDNRMLLQQAACTLHADERPLEEWAAACSVLRDLTIPAGSKEQIWRDLVNVGVSRSSLFPDLSALAMDIASKEFGLQWGLHETLGLGPEREGL